jgi:cytohesin/brefeldin A-inhibited guanine nucleotide-exchange protein
MCHEKLHGDTMKKALNLAFDLMKGSNLIKYGRRGEPKPRKMFLSEDERRVCWRAIDREEPARYINISDV